jgi:protein-serine/threonine kinase
MSPSQSSLRNFLRRGSQTASPSSNTIALPEPLSSTAMDQSPSQQSNASTQQRNSLLGLPPTLYGEARVDGGQEVRFSVEVTRIKNLAGLYSLDVRRLRGPLTSYKFLYHNVLKRVTDPNIDQ